MKRRSSSPIRWVVCTLAVLGVFCTNYARADIIYSNIVIDGSLSTDAFAVTEPFDIDFHLPFAAVGDPFGAVRAGSISITYEAQSDSGLSQMLVSILGAVSGSGAIFFNEVVEDLADPQNPQIIAAVNALIDDFDQLPYTDVIPFDHVSTHIKVKKTFQLVAPETPELDLASVILVEQRLPEPAALVSTLLLAAIALRRRRAA